MICLNLNLIKAKWFQLCCFLISQYNLHFSRSRSHPVFCICTVFALYLYQYLSLGSGGQSQNRSELPTHPSSQLSSFLLFTYQPTLVQIPTTFFNEQLFKESLRHATSAINRFNFQMSHIMMLQILDSSTNKNMSKMLSNQGERGVTFDGMCFISLVSFPSSFAKLCNMLRCNFLHNSTVSLPMHSGCQWQFMLILLNPRRGPAITPTHLCIISVNFTQGAI